MTDVTTLLAGIKTRALAATEGPWTSEDYVDVDGDGAFDLAHVTAPDSFDANVVQGVALGILRKDATFIAAARTDVPGLVAAIEAVVKIIDTPDWEGFQPVAVSGDAIRTAVVAALGGGE